MESLKSDALVLKVVAWSETSSIVTLLTRDFGKITALAKGARRPKSPFEFALDLLCHSRIVFLAKSGDVLDLLTEAKLVRRFRAAQRDLVPLYCGYYVAELLRELTDSRDPQPELFDLALETLEQLDVGHSPAEWLLRFELQLLRLIGHQPSVDQCVGCGQVVAEENTVPFGMAVGGVLCGRCVSGQRNIVRMRRESRELIRLLTVAGREETPVPEIPASVRGEIRAVVQRYLTVHFDRRWELHRFLEDLAR